MQSDTILRNYRHDPHRRMLSVSFGLTTVKAREIFRALMIDTSIKTPPILHEWHVGYIQLSVTPERN
jgi:hypothetical protein